MTQLTGYAGNTQIVRGTGKLYFGAAGSAAVLSATQGGIKFDPGIKYRILTADGVRDEAVGMREIDHYEAMISGTALEMIETHNTIMLPKSTSATGTTGEGNIITPGVEGAMFADADYIPDLRWVLDKADPASAKYTEVHFPRAICTKWELMGEDKGYAKWSFEFFAIASAVGTIPFNVKFARTAVPT